MAVGSLRHVGGLLPLGCLWGADVASHRGVCRVIATHHRSQITDECCQVINLAAVVALQVPHPRLHFPKEDGDG